METMRASLEKRHDHVAAMFDEVAPRYVLMNDVLSLGFDRLWRKATFRAVGALPGDTVLDVAAGTGTSSVEFADTGARVISCDLSEGMVAEGRRRFPLLDAVVGDAMHLPFADNVFDAVTISFGLRNIPDPLAALKEFYRVMVPGGRVVICEFSQPSCAPLKAAYSQYLTSILPLVAKRLSSNSPAYDYLAESIRDWPDQKELLRMVLTAGFGRASYRNLTGGIVAIHKGIKFAPSQRRPSHGTII
jgi:demethylmenaquinone methyltransferase/2-methoxy-6-polyprenyl-1,4-benzoquinol methylase